MARITASNTRKMAPARLLLRQVAEVQLLLIHLVEQHPRPLALDRDIGKREVVVEVAELQAQPVRRGKATTSLGSEPGTVRENENSWRRAVANGPSGVRVGPKTGFEEAGLLPLFIHPNSQNPAQSRNPPFGHVILTKLFPVLLTTFSPLKENIATGLLC